MAIRKPIFVTPVDLGTITSGNEASGFPAQHLNRQKGKGLVWRSSGSSNVWARGQFSAATSIDFCSLIGTNAQAGTRIRLRLGGSQAEVDGTAPYDSGALPIYTTLPDMSLSLDFVGQEYLIDTPGDASGISHSFLELPSVRSATWWRIDITGHAGDFQASNLVLGKKIEPANFYNFEWEFGAQDLGSLDFTRLGVWDEEDGAILRTCNFTLGWVSEAEFEASFRPIMEGGLRKVIYCCFDPDATGYRQAKTYMGTLQRLPVARSQRKPQTYSLEFQILSYI